MLKKIFLSSAILLLIGGCGATNTDSSAPNDKGSVIHSKKSICQKNDTIFFDFDSYTLSEEEQNRIDSNLKCFNKKDTLLVMGHCDERGPREYNIALGERRANSVKSYLMSKGIEANKITVDSMGKEALRCDTSNSIYDIVSGEKDMYHKQNRRGVIIAGSTTIDHNLIMKEEAKRCKTPHNQSKSPVSDKKIKKSDKAATMDKSAKNDKSMMPTDDNSIDKNAKLSKDQDMMQKDSTHCVKNNTNDHDGKTTLYCDN